MLSRCLWSIYLSFERRLLLHPVYLFGIMRRLLALIPSHSSVTFYRPFVHQEPLLCKSQPKVHVVLLMSTDCKGIPQRLQLCGGTFLKESAPCCQIFSFFSCLFPPCCHSGFLTAGRESVEPESGKEMHCLPKYHSVMLLFGVVFRHVKRRFWSWIPSVGAHKLLKGRGDGETGAPFPKYWCPSLVEWWN